MAVRSWCDKCAHAVYAKPFSEAAFRCAKGHDTGFDMPPDVGYETRRDWGYYGEGCDFLPFQEAETYKAQEAARLASVEAQRAEWRKRHRSALGKVSE